jgi:hypothetical protein
MPIACSDLSRGLRPGQWRTIHKVGSETASGSVQTPPAQPVAKAVPLPTQANSQATGGTDGLRLKVVGAALFLVEFGPRTPRLAARPALRQGAPSTAPSLFLLGDPARRLHKAPAMETQAVARRGGPGRGGRA